MCRQPPALLRRHHPLLLLGETPAQLWLLLHSQGTPGSQFQISPLRRALLIGGAAGASSLHFPCSTIQNPTSSKVP